MSYPALSLPGEGFVLKRSSRGGVTKERLPWQLRRVPAGYVFARSASPSAQDAAYRYVRAAAGSS
jgi:hypothetical protein